MRPLSHGRRPRYLHLLRWQFFFVLVPLLVLSGLGIRGILESKRGVYANAREQAERVIADGRDQLINELEKLRAVSKPPLSYPSVPLPAPENPAQRRFEEALSAPPEEASLLLARIAEEEPDSLAASGLPLLPLIQWTRLRSSPSAGNAENLCRAAVTTHPSILTPELLGRAEALLGDLNTEILAAWRKRWNDDEAARAAILSSQARIGGRAFWLRQEGGEWWIEHDQNSIRLLSKENLEALAASISAKTKALLPTYAAAEIGLGGKILGKEVKSAKLLARVEEEGFSLSAWLVDPASLYADSKRQSNWFLGLMAAALIAVLTAFEAIDRALQKEALVGKLKSNFVSSVSHELRAPLASIRLMAENLESGTVAEPGQRHGYYQLMAEECRRLSALIDNVLDFARIEQNCRVYQFVESDMAALVRDAIQLMEPRAAQRYQEIRSELDPLERLCDGLAIRQALINLLDNAIKFSPENSVITVSLKEGSREMWELSVADQGPGIPIGENSKICERFYRIGNELCRETQGAGIGLSIVKHIVEGHHGWMTIKGEPGATFTLSIPNSLTACRESS